MRALALALLLSTSVHAQGPDRVTGLPTVTDGDTLVIQGIRIRLFGVDALESS
jgi:endonuclease YncB( thermonuclease family)